MNPLGKSKRLWLYFFALGVIIVFAGCVTMQKAYQQYTMRGNIVEASDSDAHLWVGSRDGAVVGQELSVYKIVQTSKNQKQPSFQKEFTGKRKITENVDEHSAKGRVISGTAAKYNIVELTAPERQLCG